jgi:MFS family permease
MEIFVGVGYAVGPPVGGVVYESSGFRYVFITFGSIIAVSTFVLLALFPSAYFPRKAAEGHARNTWQLLGDFRILIDLLVGIVAQAALTMLEPSAQIHITNFYPEITPSKMGLLFMTAILFYAISAPLAGCISDSRVGRHPVIIIGLFFIAFGLYMFGPIGWPFTISLPVLISGLAVVGLGMGTTTVPLVPDIIEAAGHGNEETAAGVAGMFTIGDIIGPALGSILIEKFEFNTSAATFGIAALTLAIALIIMRVFGVISNKPVSRSLHVH